MDIYGRTLVLGRSCKREVDGRPTKSPSSSGGGADCISFAALLLCFSRGSDVILYHVIPFGPMKNGTRPGIAREGQAYGYKEARLLSETTPLD